MRRNRVLVVDDEKNIRLTVAQSLEKLDLDVDSAVNGEEALEKIRRQGYQLVLLDLKLPGMDGMEVLRQVRTFNRRLRILIITAHGTIENAVEAMKLGAVDFVQKPFTPDEIRGLVSRALARSEGFLRTLQFEGTVQADKAVEGILAGNKSVEAPAASPRPETGELDYGGCMEQAKAAVEAYDFDMAAAWAQQAISIDTAQAEAFNFLGVLFELRNDKLTAQKYYRAALALDATYAPARNNLYRSTELRPKGKLDLGGGAEGERKGIRAVVSRKSRWRK